MRSEDQGEDNDYSALPAPACICWKDFLPPPDARFPCWDIREGQMQKTLAYAQVLQYWAKKASLLMPHQPCLLAGCVQELKQMMEEYVALTKDAILEGAVPQESTTGETAPMEEPTRMLASVELSSKEVAPTREPTKELAMLMAADTKLAGGPHPSSTM